MKKLFLCALAALAIVACKQAPKAETTEDTTDAAAEKTLVAYFSATGTTQAAAELLAQALEAEVFRIEPVEAYTEDDLNWRDSLSRSSVEMKDIKARPAIKALPVDLRQYKKIYLGFPIWWGVAPRVINTFIEESEFADVTIVPFATSGGSEIDEASKALAETYTNLTFESGRLLNDATPADIEAWVKGE